MSNISFNKNSIIKIITAQKNHTRFRHAKKKIAKKKLTPDFKNLRKKEDRIGELFNLNENFCI